MSLVLNNYARLFVYVLQASQDTYNKLDHKLFEAYIEIKSNPIVGTMETNMYRGHFDWKTCRQPTGRYS